jgi:ABC-type dipeptide/oligopeptide/nickel transport system ATPase component
VTLLNVRNLCVDFAAHKSAAPVVKGVDLDVDVGEVVGLVGESGSGKSLTSRAVMRLIQYPGRVTADELNFDGRDVLGMTAKDLRDFRAHDVGMVFQDPFSSLNPVYRIGAQLSETLRRNLGVNRAEARSQAVTLLERVGIPHADRHYQSYPHELSGGMRQRVMIALATASKPRLLLADEPTTALDVLTQKQILELLTEMRRDLGMSMLLVSHDFGVIAQMCDRVAVMVQGAIVEAGPVAKIYDAPEHPYTKSLLAAVPRLEWVPQDNERRTSV